MGLPLAILMGVTGEVSVRDVVSSKQSCVGLVCAAVYSYAVFIESSCRLTLDDGVWMFAHWLAGRRELADSRCYRANIASVSLL